MSAEARVQSVVDRYKRTGETWVTIGAREGEDGKKHGGTPVRINGEGKIDAGPPSLKSEKLDSLSDHFRKHVRNARAAHAKAAGKSGHDYTTKQAEALGSDRKVAHHQAAKEAARGTGIAAHRIMAEMPNAHQYLTAQNQQREQAKAELRKNLGLTSGDAGYIENRLGRDHSTVKGFDTAARDIAERYPDLGFNPDSSDTSAKMWELLREGKGKHIAEHSPEVAQLAAEWLKGSKSTKEPTADREPGDDDWSIQPRTEHSSSKRAKDVIPFSKRSIEERIATASGRLDAYRDREFYEKRKAAANQMSLWGDEDEAKHPRNEVGEFSKKDGSSVILSKSDFVKPSEAETKPEVKEEKKMTTQTKRAVELTEIASAATKKAKQPYEMSTKFASNAAQEAAEKANDGDMVAAADAHFQAFTNHYAASMALKRLKKTPAIVIAIAAHEAAQEAHDYAKSALGGGTKIGRAVSAKEEQEHLRRQKLQNDMRVSSPQKKEEKKVMHIVRGNTREGISQDHMFDTRAEAERFAASRGLGAENIRSEFHAVVDLGPNGTFN